MTKKRQPRRHATAAEPTVDPFDDDRDIDPAADPDPTEWPRTIEIETDDPGDDAKSANPDDPDASQDAIEPEILEDAPPTPEERIEALEKEVEELKEKNLRARAEFDNFRKRSLKQQEITRFNAKLDTLAPLLKVFDTVHTAADMAENSQDMKGIREGISLLVAEFDKVMDKLGVKAVDALGETFDPNLHEAVASDPSDEEDEGKVIKQWSKGYLLGDKLLRPATVVVGAGPA